MQTTYTNVNLLRYSRFVGLGRMNGWRCAIAIAIALAASGCAARPRFELGTECELSTECAAPLVCRLGRCRDECRVDRDCRAGLVCLREDGLGACEIEGETCVLTSDCTAPLVCLMGRCANGCESDVDCPAGSMCVGEGDGGARGCRDQSTTECEHNTDCVAPEICTPDRMCREQCVVDRDCRDGTVCVLRGGLRVCELPGAPDGGTSDAGMLDASTSDAGMIDGGMSVVVGPAPEPLLVAGERHTCATIAGELRCWGDNFYGQLADGTGGTSAVPRPITTLSGTTILAAGALHACAWSGSLRCWGANASGQVGDGSTTQRNAPVAIAGVPAATWIAGAAAHTCAVSAGSVLCWGANASGQLGDGTTMQRRVPTATQPLAAGAAEVTTRGSHTCARLVDGRVQCWGDNRFGQLGHELAPTSPSPALVGGVSDAVEVLAGSNFTCARRSDGAVLCWGSNSMGQLGDGTVTPRAVPAAVPGLPPVVELATGTDHVCARTIDGDVYCWGGNLFGQAARDPLVFMADRQRSPVLVGGVVGATELAAGDAHTCARIGTALRCWGANMFGQLGNGTMTESWMPVAVSGT